MTEQTNALASTLREIADRLETAGLHPEHVTFNLHSLSKTELASFARAFPGRITKGSGGESFWLTASIGPLDVNAFAKSRDDVCRKVVVGVEEIPEEVVPAYTREIVEWECEPILSAAIAPDEVTA